MGKKQEREKEDRVTEYANKIMEKRERKLRRKLTKEEIDEAFQIAYRREEKRIRMKRKIVGILAALGITIGGGAALLTAGGDNEPKTPTEQETDIDNEKDNETSKTEREKFLEELQEGVGENVNETEENLDSVINEILEKYNANLLEQAQIDKDDLGIIHRDNMGEAQIFQTTSPDGEIIYVNNPLVSGILPEGQEWVEAQYIDDEYILVDTENQNTIAGIGTIHDAKTEIDVQYADFGGTEYVKNNQTYVGIPEDMNIEEAYEDFSEYYQSRVQQQEGQQQGNAQIQNDGWDR